jgi:hypothetical protein
MQNIIYIGMGATGVSAASLLGYCIAFARVRAKLARERDRHADLLADLRAQLDRVAKQRDDHGTRVGELEAELDRSAARPHGTPNDVAEHRHVVVFDGPVGSGKTTFATKFLSPTMSRTELEKIKPTTQPGMLGELSLAAERTASGKLSGVHTVRLMDVGGSRPQTIDTIHEAQRRAVSGKVIAIWLYDMTQIDAMRARFSPVIIQATYGSRAVKDIVSGIFVFFNRVPGLGGQDGPAKLRTEIEYVSNLLRQADLNDKWSYHAGATLDDRGLVTALGFIHQQLGLAAYTPPLLSLATLAAGETKPSIAGQAPADIHGSTHAAVSSVRDGLHRDDGRRLNGHPTPGRR